jgi:hypothetical protein
MIKNKHAYEYLLYKIADISIKTKKKPVMARCRKLLTIKIDVVLKFELILLLVLLEL